MEGGCVEMRSVLEGCERWYADEIIAGPVIGLAGAFPDRGASSRQELINCRIAFVWIARLRITQSDNGSHTAPR